ncbi:MAG TPA: erythromycin esterase family protein [Longimicrobium sp.]|nr:erythromycin esterase family protein [Longimicrobium sp.]
MIQRTLALLLALALAACSGGDNPTIEPPNTDDPPAEVTAWLKANAIPFNTPQAGNGFADLQKVKALVGDARVVSLGEATHGTREFFEMKHRMFEFLVREMGFTVFAIESEWAEAARLNHWVQTGEGDPHKLLTGLYFWTWRTQEVMDLIQWMRAYNADPANVKKVSFVGVDMQFPTLAMDTTVAFLRRADPAMATTAEERYACLRPYSNNTKGASPTPYTSAGPAAQLECAQKVRQVHDEIAANSARLAAATSPAEYAFSLQAARLVVQGEDGKAGRTSAGRDLFMAENAAWWLEQFGPGAKMVIWAHNGHVATEQGWMGYHLRGKFGAAMRVFGFSFYQGSFTAVNLDGGPFGTYSFGPAPPRSYEAWFHSAGIPRFILDLRLVQGDPAAGWLNGPLITRQVGCCHRPSIANWGIRLNASLPAAYDAIIFFENTTASQTLPVKWE